MSTRSLAYFTDLALRRQEGSVVTSQAGYTAVRSPQNPTFWWGNFLLMPRPPHAGDVRRWTALFRAEFPEARHMAFGVDTPDADAGDPDAAIDAFQAAGFEVMRDTVLTTARTQAPRAPNRDAHCRPLSSEADWDAALALRLAVNAADPHPHEERGYQVFAARKLASYRAVQQAGLGATFAAVAEDGQVLSMLGIFDAGEGIARYQSVETHPQARSRGLAGTLVHQAGEWAREHLGTRTLVIVADPDYHAQALYERVGFRPSEVQLALQNRP